MAPLRALRHAARMLARFRGTTLLAITCLALGIGIVATMFASADPWLFRPLPYAQPERLVVLRELSPRGRPNLVSVPLYEELGAERRAIATIGAVVRTAFNLSTEQEPERVRGAAITASMPVVLGVAPIAGRTFTADEDRPGAPRVCVIGADLARRRFGVEGAALGRTLRLDGEVHTVVGVMPGGWRFPEYAEVWTPLRLPAGDRDRRGRRLDVIARLADGVDLPRAAERLVPVARRAATLDPEAAAGWTLRVETLAGTLTPPGVRVALHLMLAAAVLVLLIAASNVANLLLALAIERRREMATRLALGATPRRLVGQMLAESLLLACGGGVAGLGLAAWGADAMSGGFGAQPPFWADMHLTWRVALVTVAAGALAAVVSSVLPALAALRGDVREALQENGRTVSAGVRTRRLATLVAGTELAVAVVLLTGALLLLRSYANRQALDPGFDPEHALATRVSLSGPRYAAPADRMAFLRAILGDIKAQSGIDHAAAVRSLPFTEMVGGGWLATAFEVEGDFVEPSRRPLAVFNAGTATMLETLGIPLVRGRSFLEAEVETAARVALVSQRTADRFWNGDAIGRRLRFEGEEWLTIVGITGDVHEPASVLGLVEKPEWQVYIPYTLDPSPEPMVVVRGPAAEASAETLRRIIRARDPQLPLYDVTTMRSARYRADWVARLWGNLLACGALVGALLACAGVYGVVARGVARRRQEFGVRMALGAAGPQVIGLVMAGGMKVAIISVAAGAAGALAFSRVLSSLLFGVSPWDPVVFASSTMTLLALALIATYLPARRATRITPSQALRAE
jgi:predicted permease